VGILLSTNYLNNESDNNSSLSDNSKSMLVYQICLKDSKNNENALKLLDINDKLIVISNIIYNPF